MSARSRRESRRLITLQEQQQAQMQTSEVQVIQLSDTIVLSAPTINPMYMPAPRPYLGQPITPEEQDELDSLIEAAYERDR